MRQCLLNPKGFEVRERHEWLHTLLHSTGDDSFRGTGYEGDRDDILYPISLMKRAQETNDGLL